VEVKSSVAVKSHVEVKSRAQVGMKSLRCSTENHFKQKYAVICFHRRNALL